MDLKNLGNFCLNFLLLKDFIVCLYRDGLITHYLDTAILQCLFLFAYTLNFKVKNNKLGIPKKSQQIFIPFFFDFQSVYQIKVVSKI